MACAVGHACVMPAHAQGTHALHGTVHCVHVHHTAAMADNKPDWRVVFSLYRLNPVLGMLSWAGKMRAS